MRSRSILAAGAGLVLVAAGSRAQDLPQVAAAFAAAASDGAPPLLLVFVRPGRPPVVHHAGFAEPKPAVPLGDLSVLALGRTLATFAASSGWTLDEALAASGEPTLGRTQTVGDWTWRQVLERRAKGALPAYRFLGPRDEPRGSAEIVATHALPGDLPSSRDDLPIAALVLALEHRTGRDFEAWLARAAAPAGMPGLRVGGPEVALFARAAGGLRPDGAQPRAEVEAGFGLCATAADLASLLRWLAEAPDERFRLGSQRSFRGRPQTSRRASGTKFGAACEIELLGEDRVAWCLWSAVRGSDERFAVLRAALLEDLLGPPAEVDEDEDQTWTSAVGLGFTGGRGDLPPQPIEWPGDGRLRARLVHLGRTVDLELRLGDRLAEAQIVGGDRVDVLPAAPPRIDGELWLDADTTLSLALQVDGEALTGHGIARSAGLLLPYRLRFGAVRAGEPAPVPRTDIPSLRRPFPAAMDAVERQLVELFAGVESARLIAVGRADGATWDRAFGEADPDRGLEMRRVDRVPLGTLTRELFVEAFALLDRSGRLDGMRAIEPLFDGKEPPFDARLLRLSPWQLMAGAAPLPEHFRAVRDPLRLRPLDEVLASHAFFVSRTDELASKAALARAVLVRALEEGAVIDSWPSFLASELGPVLGMPQLADATDAGADLARLRLRGPGGDLRPAPRFEIAVDAGAWARAGNVAGWITALVQDAARWEARSRAYVSGRNVPACVLAADREDMTCRILLVPAMELGIFVWGADGDRSWVGPAVEAVLAAFWKPIREPTFHWVEPRPTPPRHREPATGSTPLADAPCSFRGDVPALGAVELHCGAEAGNIRLTIDGRDVELLQVRTRRRTLELRSTLPAEAAPDRAAGAELWLSAVIRSTGLSGEIELVRDGWFRLPYPLSLSAADRGAKGRSAPRR